MQWDQELDEKSAILLAGSDMPEREEQFVAAPVAYLIWRAAGIPTAGGWLVAPSDEAASFEVVDEAGVVCLRDELRGFWWPNEQPPEVLLRWEAGEQQKTARLPVLDQFGRLATKGLQALGIEEAWLHLASFPMPPDEDDLPGPDDGEQEGIGIAPTPQQRPGAGANYPIRQIMQLIENIALKQTAIEATDWTAWCIRLEQSLSAAAENEVLQGFRKLAINPLSPLWHQQFRPGFAEKSNSAEGVRYEAVLKRLEAVWKVGELERLEA